MAPRKKKLGIARYTEEGTHEVNGSSDKISLEQWNKAHKQRPFYSYILSLKMRTSYEQATIRAIFGSCQGWNRRRYCSTWVLAVWQLQVFSSVITGGPGLCVSIARRLRTFCFTLTPGRTKKPSPHLVLDALKQGTHVRETGCKNSHSGLDTGPHTCWYLVVCYV